MWCHRCLSIAETNISKATGVPPMEIFFSSRVTNGSKIFEKLVVEPTPFEKYYPQIGSFPQGLG